MRIGIIEGNATCNKKKLVLRYVASPAVPRILLCQGNLVERRCTLWWRDGVDSWSKRGSDCESARVASCVYFMLRAQADLNKFEG